MGFLLSYEPNSCYETGFPSNESDYTIRRALTIEELPALSTILDALRKVEREAAQLAQQPSPPSDNSLPRVLAEKRNRKVFRRLIIVITIALLAGTGVAFTLGQRVFSPKETATAPEVAAVAAKDKETVAPIVPVKQREEPPKPATVVKKPVPEPEKLIKKEEPVPVPSKKDETTLPVTAKVLQKPALQIPLRS
ncbi:MAG: hypothetical protein ACM335_07605, partial [Deltaproteobacteria bacterium]